MSGQMERVEIAEGLSFSRLVYGMWRIGDDTDTSAGHVRAKIDACLAQGITTLDQADIYGGYTAEAILGSALKADKGLRDRLEIVTKCDIVAPAGKFADRDGQALRHLGRPYRGVGGKLAAGHGHRPRRSAADPPS